MLLPVPYAQVAERVKASCPDVSNLLLKLQGKTGSKYFTVGKVHPSEPFMVALNVSLMITPSQRQHVSHILADIELAPLIQGNKVDASQPGALKTQSSLYATQQAPPDSTGSSAGSQAMRPSSASAVLTVPRPVTGAASYPRSSPDVSPCMLELLHSHFFLSRMFVLFDNFCT